MAGSRIKGITVEIGGDTTKLQTALKGVNSEIKNTQSQLKDVEKLLKLDPGNTELLTQKQKLLSSAVSETKEKLATLKTAAEQANQALADGDISKEQYDALQREIFFRFDDLPLKSIVLFFRGRSSKRKKISKSWRHRQISLPLLCRRLLLLVKA